MRRAPLTALPPIAGRGVSVQEATKITFDGFFGKPLPWSTTRDLQNPADKARYLASVLEYLADVYEVAQRGTDERSKLQAALAEKTIRSYFLVGANKPHVTLGVLLPETAKNYPDIPPESVAHAVIASFSLNHPDIAAGLTLEKVAFAVNEARVVDGRKERNKGDRRKWKAIAEALREAKAAVSWETIRKDCRAAVKQNEQIVAFASAHR